MIAQNNTHPRMNPNNINIQWPSTFQVFGPYRTEMDTNNERWSPYSPNQSAACTASDARAQLPFPNSVLTEPPSELTINGETYTPRLVQPIEELLDFNKAFGGSEEFDEVFVTARIHSEHSCRLWIGLSGNWWMQWWINGRRICDTMHRGNYGPIASPIQRIAPLILEKGENTLCGRVIAGDLGHAVLISAPTTIQQYIDFARQDPAPIDGERAQAGIQKLLKRLQQSEIDSGDQVNTDAIIEDLPNTLTPDGRWPDVDYTDDNRAQWATAEHLRRLSLLAKAIARQDDPTPHWIEAARRALKAWTDERFQCPNWWFNRICIPGQMATILLALRQHLATDEFEAGLDIVRQVTMTPNGLTEYGQPVNGWSTGANAMWVIERAIALGCLTNDPELITRAQLHVARICAVSENEGIKPDYSFHQHGAQFYSGGYGAAYVAMAAKMAELLHDTPWALAENRVQTLSNFLLEGQQWLVYADRAIPTAQGRGISRDGVGAPGSGKGFIRSAHHLVNIDTANQARLQQMIDRFLNHDQSAGSLIGNRNFWCSDVMVHRRDAFVTSIRAVSERTQSMETCNSENMRGIHAADGLVLQWRTGAEYDAIFPVWDWEKLPGVTCTHGKTNLIPKSVPGPTDFVGGASDNEYGFFAYDFRAIHEPQSLHARKTWFCFDNCMVWLGADICCDDDLPVLTTIDQRRLTGDVLAGNPGNLTVLTQGEHQLPGNHWVWHDRVAYTPLDDQPRMLSNQDQTGGKHLINPGRHAKPNPVTLPIFTRWFDHGVKPKSESYAELVTFDIDRKDVPSLADNCPVQVLSNTAAIQAVEHPGLNITMAAFYEPGQIGLTDGRVLRADESCLVMLRNGKTKTVTAPAQTSVTASNDARCLLGAIQEAGPLDIL